MTLSGCKHCGADDLDRTFDPQDVKCPNASPCNSCKELANLEIFIVRLEKKRVELKRNINRAHSSFIRLIPPEIIGSISVFANTDSTIIGSLPTPIVLSSICSDWRRTVVGTPQLWSSIKIIFRSFWVDRDFLRLATSLGTRLVRSGQLPLHISLRFAFAHLHSRAGTIFKILNECSFRWLSLHISLPKDLSWLQPKSLPLLEQLNINAESRYITDVTVLNFPSSPRLKTVGIKNICLSNIGIQCNTVTHLSADNLDVQECLRLLRLTPHLVHCTFHHIICGTSQALLEPPILNPLTYLSLHPYSESFLDNIILPSLETLVLNLLRYDIDSLTAFFKRSACSLRSLSLQNLWQDFSFDTHDRLFELLQFLSPSLTKLLVSRIPDLHSVGRYLSILAETYSSQTTVPETDFLPHLENFQYIETYRHIISLPDFPVWDYPESTRPIPLRLVHVHLDAVPDSADIVSILCRLNQDGILIVSGHQNFTAMLRVNDISEDGRRALSWYNLNL